MRGANGDDARPDLPEGWEWRALGEIAECRLGKMLDSGKNVGALRPYLRNTNVQWGHFDLSDVKEMRVTDEELDRVTIWPGDLLVCEGGEPGRCAIWREDRPICFQKALHRVRPHEGVSAEYLQLYLRYAAFSGKLRPHLTGTTIKHLPAVQLARIAVPLPPPGQQGAIIRQADAWLTHLGEGTDHLRDVERNGSRYARSVIRDAVTGDVRARDGHLPAGWTRSTLGEIGAYHNGRAFKKEEWRSGGRPIIRIQNLTDASRPYNYFAGEAEERHIVRPGDILVSWAATLDSFRWNGPEAVLNQHIFKVESQIDPDFHFYLLKNALPRLYAVTHGTGMVHVTRTRFNSVPVLIPPRAQQAEIVRGIERQLHGLRQLNETRVATSKTAKRMTLSVLGNAVTGRLGTLAVNSARDGSEGMGSKVMEING